MESNNEKKLKKLLEEINRKTEKLVNKSIIKTALNVGIDINEVAEKYESKVQDYRIKMRAKITSEHQKEIDCLILEINKEKNIVKPKTKKPKKKVKSVVKNKTEVKEKVKPEAKLSKRQKEMNLIKEKLFGENLGYKEIASLLGKDEEKIKKIVVKIMCESVA